MNEDWTDLLNKLPSQREFITLLSSFHGDQKQINSLLVARLLVALDKIARIERELRDRGWMT